MKNKWSVVFIAVSEYESLGVGYMAAILAESGHRSKVIDFNNKKENILRSLKRLNPLIVGFSVVYQYHIDKFAELIRYLRISGINCHFTAGGHYASVKPDELFDQIPWLDSIIRFEGERPMLDLTKMINDGKDWKKIKNLVTRHDNKIITNPIYPIEKDLDKLPYPKRLHGREYALNKKFATLISGRGCVYDCSFCNIKEFYRLQGGPVKRKRDPEKVVEEMSFLFHKKKCSVFLFQDDDFPIEGTSGNDWLTEFCKELKRRELSDKILWKINCRPDEIDEEKFLMMKEHGLYLVFLGIEDGTEAGLKRLNKKMSVEKSLEGINILKKLDIGFDYGFLLFQPDSDFRSVKENLNFLGEICSDGYAPVMFLKLMPYYETRVEKDLLKEGRITGAPGYRTYDFYESSMNQYFDFISTNFIEWTRYPEGVVNMSKWVRNNLYVYSKYFKPQPEVFNITNRYRRTMSESNAFFINTMMELSLIFKNDSHNGSKKEILDTYILSIRNKHQIFKKQLANYISNLKFIAAFY